LTARAQPAGGPVRGAGDVEVRARLSRGTSGRAIYAMVRRALAERGAGGVLVDVGCGSGELWSHVRDIVARYVGVDAVRYDGFPAEAAFAACDLDHEPVPLEGATADVAASVETIEHLENPRALMRELTRLARPGGWVVVTTPNQLSALSLSTLVLKHRFSAFQDVAYPAHRTALLEVDLVRMARECGLEEVAVRFSLEGRVPLTPYRWPAWVSRLLPRALSDNVLLVGRRPAGTSSRDASADGHGR
jgi:2-polyprenyl-3-methyl-5-hydroxy-6-metoxy-1,4-benzoquinol methylase